jgi:hypothetical protein
MVKVPLTGIPTPSGGWQSTLDQVTSGKLPGFKGDSLVLSFGDTATPMYVITPPTTSGPGGTATKEDWEALTSADVVSLSNTATKPTEQVILADLDNDGQNELINVYNNQCAPHPMPHASFPLP